MGYNEKTLSIVKMFDFKNKTIVELGSQDLSIDILKVNEFILNQQSTPKSINTYLYTNFSKLSSKYLYHSLECKKYVSIDIDGVYDSLKFNLNNNLEETYNYKEQFDFVTNFGTTEHIFNQASAFENIHNLTLVNGLMIHTLPIEGYLNHCLFNYQPLFFEELAEANGYEIILMEYTKHSYYKKDDSKSITVIYEKREDKSFNFPMQTRINTIPKMVSNNKRELNERFKLITNIDASEIKNIAIFGAANAGKIAYEYSKLLNANIICFIDDFETGYYKDTIIPILSLEEFNNKFSDKIDIILQGTNQKGSLEKKLPSNIKLIEISALLFDV